MDVKMVIDYRIVLAVGASVAGIIFAIKLDPVAVKEISHYTINAVKEYAVDPKGICHPA